jgi:SAM-dependent methyltransferase
VSALAGAPRLVPAPRLYGRLLVEALRQALAGDPPSKAAVRRADGRIEPLPLARWLGPADAVDAAVLELVDAPVLDIGCGPGRHLAALRSAGRGGLGVDLSPVAVSIAIDRGADARLGSVFDGVPDEGRWRTALLLDGNVGIGGSPSALLRRVRQLLAPRGRAIVELDPPDAPTRRTSLRLEAPGVVSEWFPWATVGVDGVGALAAASGLRLGAVDRHGERWFATMSRP